MLVDWAAATSRESYGGIAPAPSPGISIGVAVQHGGCVGNERALHHILSDARLQAMTYLRASPLMSWGKGARCVVNASQRGCVIVSLQSGSCLPTIATCMRPHPQPLICSLEVASRIQAVRYCIGVHIKMICSITIHIARYIGGE